MKNEKRRQKKIRKPKQCKQQKKNRVQSFQHAVFRYCSPYSNLIKNLLLERLLKTRPLYQRNEIREKKRRDK